MSLTSRLSNEDMDFLMKSMVKGPESLSKEDKQRWLMCYQGYMQDAGILNYKPSPKFWDFHKSSAQIRLLHGGNRVGKTYSGAAEIVWMALCMHPFRPEIQPDEYWVVSETYKVQEEASQRKIIDFLPPELVKKANWVRAGILESVILDVVKDGKKLGESKITFKSSDSGVRSFAGAGKRGIWFDEEPPFDIYQECLARIQAGKDLSVWLTMTPIFEQRAGGGKTGMSWTYRELYAKRGTGRIDCFAIGLEDNVYLSKEQIEEQKKKYHGVEYDIRIKGEFKLLSGNCVFDIEALHESNKDLPEPKFCGQLNDAGNSWKLTKNERGPLKIWRWPSESSRFFIGADIGLGVGGDPSCAVVFDEQLRQCAELHGQINPQDMGKLLINLGKYYKNAWVGIEANSFGIATIDTIKQKYGKLYFRYKVDQRSDIKTKQLGWWTDARSKPLMISEFGNAFREGAVELNSAQLMDEMGTYVLGVNGTANAEVGCHDDRVIAAMIAFQVRKKHLIHEDIVRTPDYVPTSKIGGY